MDDSNTLNLSSQALRARIEALVRAALAKYGVGGSAGSLEKLASSSVLPSPSSEVSASLGSNPSSTGRFHFPSAVPEPILVAANWKMNMDRQSALQFAAAFKSLEHDGCSVLICPPAYLLMLLQREFQGLGIDLGAQTMHWESHGAYTGEHSLRMIQDAGGSYVIIGHSERRQLFRETDHEINQKLIAALHGGLRPILCIGERLEERESNATFRLLRNQLHLALRNTAPYMVEGMVVAYEPIWAIGTGRTASPDQAEEAHAFIRGVLEELYNYTTATATRILYGGSVTPDNAEALIEKPNVNGFLVGGASLDAAKFRKIITLARKHGTTKQTGT